MDTKKLRQKILDLAIHGKLVPQDPNDEPASVLLERIRAEKERLISEGKIKRSKKSATSDTPHYENVPFEVPEGWCWRTLGEIGSWQAGGTPSRMHKEYYGGNIPWLKTGDLNDSIVTSIPEYITEVGLNNSSAKLNPAGSVLIAMYGATIGKVGILGIPATTNQACCACFDYNGVTQRYLFYFLLSHKEEFVALGGGGAQPNISKDIIIKTFIPIPPYNEQMRIVSEIEKLLGLLDSLDMNKISLEKAISQAKSKILDLAIHGKLVPQDPTDEPAAELVKRINPKAVTSCDNPQYGKVPSSWVISTVGEIFTINPKTHVKDDTEAAFVPMTFVADGYSNTFEYECKKWGDIKKGFVHFQDNDVAVAKISPCLENRKSVVFHDLPNGIGAGTTELNVFRCAEILPEYALFYFKSQMFIGSCAGTYNGVVGQQRVAKSFIQELPIGIPPYKEQLRIVSKINELFLQLDLIEKSLQA